MSSNSETADYLADLELLERMFARDFDWEAWYEPPEGDEPEEVFRRVYKWHDYRKGNRSVGVVDCCGHKFSDTPRALYRVCHLVQPEEVNFEDMYKTGSLIDLCSPDQQFMVSFQLHKHEACLRFYCAPQHAIGRPSAVQGGWASCDNGVKCKSEPGLKWFAVAVQSLEREWDVYSGNRFVV